MIYPLKNVFLNEIKNEIKIFTKNETYINSNDPLGILIHDIFQVAAHTRYGIKSNEVDNRIYETINRSLRYLENMVVELAIKYEAVILEHHKQEIDPQKFIDYTQSEAEELSFQLYPRDQIKILRNFHIYYLTYVKASNSLVKARINKSHADLRKIVKDQQLRGDPTYIYDNQDRNKEPED
ncbi:hypothetical protein [Spiroplasma endosymbiont of Aspidapion aeneum]|uniref:hypothetical protein n=1 Tax=Spiroplasma endosymbiont of Aspidapion aeneum TaxID=3066276 RepID=UPI00313C3A46